MRRGKGKPIIQPEEEIARIRTPRQSELLGIIETMLGGDKMRVKCDDGNTRVCRIPGRLRKRVWMRVGDLVLIEPWEAQPEERGDVVFRYTATQANWLKRKGFVKTISIE
jgi:translation initiation factor 1A